MDRQKMMGAVGMFLREVDPEGAKGAILYMEGLNDEAFSKVMEFFVWNVKFVRDNKNIFPDDIPATFSHMASMAIKGSWDFPDLAKNFLQVMK